MLNREMVLLFLLSLAIDTTIFITKSTFSLGRYIIYGHEETSEEKIQKMLQDYKSMKIELEELKTTVYNKNSPNVEIHQSS